MLWLLLGIVLLMQSEPLPRESEVTPVVVAALAGYSEGVVFDAAGNGYVSLLRRDRVLRFRPGAPPEEWAVLAEPNGHKILPNGTHLIATKAGVVRLRSDGTIIDTAAARYDGVPLQGPNDIALDGNGGYYVTDPAATPEAAADRQGRVYYVDSAGRLYLAASGFCYPNGIIVRPDGRVFLVNDSCTSQVYAFDVRTPGTLANRRVFATLPDSGSAALDGMTMDRAGHLFVAHYRSGRIEVLDSTGTLVRRYAAGNPLASNVAFGGAALDELYVTGAPGLESGPGVLMLLRLPGVRGRDSRALPERIP